MRLEIVRDDSSPLLFSLVTPIPEPDLEVSLTLSLSGLGFYLYFGFKKKC